MIVLESALKERDDEHRVEGMRGHIFMLTMPQMIKKEGRESPFQIRKQLPTVPPNNMIQVLTARDSQMMFYS
jgi:hypothetical protein